jgi:PEP-CTERM motif
MLFEAERTVALSLYRSAESLRISMKNFSLLVLTATGLLTVVSPAFAGLTTAAPEPSTIMLAGAGVGALILFHRRRRNKK